MDNQFMNMVNQRVSENARFARSLKQDIQANPQKYAGGSQQSSANAMQQMMGMLSPMLMLMLFQMMLGQSGQGKNPPGSLPDYYLPFLNGLNGNNNGRSSATPPAPAPSNAATTYLDTLFKSKADNQTAGLNLVLSAEDVQAVREELAIGNLKSGDLGQALKYKLDNAPDSQADAIGRLITDLNDSGHLHIEPFLKNEYLAKLSPERREVLLGAVELAGLRLDNGKPNARFIGFLLQNLGKDNQPQTQAFLREFLQDFYDAHGKTPNTPVGKILSQTLSLAGVTADDKGKLIF